MRKLVKLVCGSLSFLLIVNMSSCKKEEEPGNDENATYAVAIRFKEFDQAIHPLEQAVRAPSGLSKLASTTRPATPTTEGSLYYWSFNQETLAPDVAVNAGASIMINQGNQSAEYSSGWVYDEYAAGHAVSISGLNELVIRMPLDGVSLVSSLGLDMGSSGTGPKSFALSYSQDGVNYSILSTNNQFSNTNTAHAKNSFTYQLDAISLDYSKDLYLKWIPTAGERGTASAYRESTGVAKLDNIRLIGTRGEAPATAKKTLHYHIFDAVSEELVLTGLYDYGSTNIADFSLSLPAGNYIASFVSNESSMALPIPTDVMASSYFISNIFANHNAKIFGTLLPIVVEEDMELELTLNRYYSEVKFEFSDKADLSEVTKLVITGRHMPVFYAPFNAALVDPLQDGSVVTINPQFTADNKSITFNQFIGDVTVPLAVSYKVEAYNASNAVIKSFNVEASILNNVQLLFRGALLNAGETGTNFAIMFNEIWNGNQVVDF